eukprot:TRINITY_DN57325_c0_g1_i1.p1 TRINITY_DN57325_c0_g1~~TRINITY_DN57325_c0_g1_i1.p1  ORF type:complete len:422 (-),score=44.25 TRINITY_DN57325_c0_g1_i1:74-1339(-)
MARKGSFDANYLKAPLSLGIDLLIGFIVLAYALLQWHHIYETAVKVPLVQRVVRVKPRLRFPNLLVCPADRGATPSPLRWRGFDCHLAFRTERINCDAQVRLYRGWAPEYFGGTEEKNGGQCLEFDTHSLFVREEWSASWNELTLRAAFDEESLNGPDALREVELGYQIAERRLADNSMDRYYYPLRRVPYFSLESFYDKSIRTFASDDAIGSYRSSGEGAATRMFLREELDQDRRLSGMYWQTYGGSQVRVVNPTVPSQVLNALPTSFNHSGLLAATNVSSKRMRAEHVVHLIISLDDFTEISNEVVSSFIPTIKAAGEVAGVAALLLWIRAARAEAAATLMSRRKPYGMPTRTEEVESVIVNVPAFHEVAGGVTTSPRMSPRGDAGYSRLATDEDDSSRRPFADEEDSSSASDVDVAPL